MSETILPKIQAKAYVDYFESLAKSRFPKLYEQLLRYDDVPILKALKNKGMFCGMDYVGIDMIRPGDFYSRDDHSRVCAFLILCLTGNLKVALAARVHDCGTYPFAHIKSYKEKNEAYQDNDEADILSLILNDKVMMRLLGEDKINPMAIANTKRYPVLEKERPALCIDRFDGILSAAHIWTKEFALEEIKELALLSTVCFQKHFGNDAIDDFERKDYGIELCLKDYWNSVYNVSDFLDAIRAYSTWQLSKESRFATAFLGEILRFMDKKGIIPKNYFYLTEEEMIQRFLASPYAILWHDFTNLRSVSQATSDDRNKYILNPKTKVRYAEPLVVLNGSPSDDILYEIGLDNAIFENKGPLYSDDISDETKKFLLR